MTCQKKAARWQQSLEQKPEIWPAPLFTPPNDSAFPCTHHTATMGSGCWVKNKVSTEVPRELPFPGAIMLLYSMGFTLFCCAYINGQNGKQRAFWSLLRCPSILTDACSSPTLVPIAVNSKTPIEHKGKSWAEGTLAESPTVTLCRTTCSLQSVAAQICILSKDSSAADFPWAESIVSRQVHCCFNQYYLRKLSCHFSKLYTDIYQCLCHLQDLPVR